MNRVPHERRATVVYFGTIHGGVLEILGEVKYS